LISVAHGEKVQWNLIFFKTQEDAGLMTIGPVETDAEHARTPLRRVSRAVRD
jgi:hypothetical protein